jgi:predicted ATPase/DNA-binding SARP family transcriptional activator
VTPAQAVSARVPAPLTPLIGRDGRVETAWQALQGTRLLTLTGTGGGGKTRLAMELASRVERAAWVELATLADPRFVAEHVATTLGVPDRSGKPSLTHIVERFSSHPLLLVLDNCEHVVEASAGFVAQLLRECPLMKVLATSRESLGVAGERTLGVPPLSVPKDDSLDAAQESDAIALFVERAQDVRAGFELNARNAPAIARICRRLDGIPLAIELAAARVRALDPEQLAERLESSIGLLETGSRAALPRHRTIRDTLDWSHRLLSDGERRLLRRLSVFNGTFALDAVEAVCADPNESCGAVLDLVTGLLDKSLLLCDAGEAGTRYRLLETVREYAAEHLASAGETDMVRDRHARFFVSLAERAAPAIFGGVGDESWIARLDEDTANLREANDWCEQQTSRLELSLRLAVALHWYWYARGRFTEGRLRVGIALTFSEGVNPVLRGRALTVLGRMAIWQGDYANVHGPMEEAVALLRPHGDRPSLAYALHGLGIAAALQGREDDARRLLDEASLLTEFEPPEPLTPWIERWRGRVAEWDRDLDGARRAYERALAAARRLQHKSASAHALSAMGRLAASTGQLEAAERALQESMGIFREIEDRWGVAFALQGLARVAASSGRASDAAALLGASDALREELGVDVSPPLRAYQEATIAIALPALGEAAFWSAWTNGKNQTDPPALAPAEAPAAVVDLRIRVLGAFETHVRNHRVEKTEWGSSRARELLAFIACHPDGCTKAQIGLALWPDASPGQLRNTFHVTMHRLRHALAIPDAIQVEGDRYRLNPALTREFDADLFEREARAAIRDLRRGTDATPALEAALARYRGDFLAGEPAGEWADERRDRLRQLHVEGLDALGRALMERGRHADAAEAFRTLLEADPVNEEACRRQMTCLDRLGDRAGALRAYDALVRALRDELGVRPGRETAALRDKLVSTT